MTVVAATPAYPLKWREDTWGESARFWREHCRQDEQR